MEPNVKLPNTFSTDFVVNYKFIKIDKKMAQNQTWVSQTLNLKYH